MAAGRRASGRRRGHELRACLGHDRFRVQRPGTQHAICAEPERKADELPVEPAGTGELWREQAQLLTCLDLLAAQLEREPGHRRGRRRAGQPREEQPLEQVRRGRGFRQLLFEHDAVRLRGRVRARASSARASRLRHARKLLAQRATQVVEHEAQRIERVDRGLELRFGAQVLNRLPWPQRPAVHAPRQLVEQLALRAEARHDRRRGQRGELADARQAEDAQPVYPQVPEIRQYYGKSLFSCPYCDGWELEINHSLSLLKMKMWPII